MPSSRPSASPSNSPSGSWTAVSDRAAKENVEPVDVQAVLEKVAQLPLTTWNYKEQSDSIRHMGPMAQDFFAAFELGLGETTIDTIDAGRFMSGDRGETVSGLEPPFEAIEART